MAKYIPKKRVKTPKSAPKKTALEQGMDKAVRKAKKCEAPWAEEPPAKEAKLQQMEDGLRAGAGAPPAKPRKVRFDQTPPKEPRAEASDAKGPSSVLCVRCDAARRVALRFYRGNEWTEAVAIGDGGSVEVLRLRNSEFEDRFRVDGAKGSADEFEAAEKLLAVARRAHGGSSHKAMEVLSEVVAARRAAKKGKEPAVTAEQLRAAAERGRAKDNEGRASSGFAARPRGVGIGAFCCGMLRDGKSNEEVLKAVRDKFPEAKTSAASVAWYRNDLKQKGELPKD